MTIPTPTLQSTTLPATSLPAPTWHEQSGPEQSGPEQTAPAPSAPPRDIATWLLGDPAAAPAAGAVLVQHPRARLLGQLGQAARESLGRQIVGALQSVVGDDLVDLLRQGWAKHRALLTASRETAGHAHAERVVQMAEHQITFTHQPTVDTLLDQVEVLVLTAKVEVIFDIGRVDAIVRSGRLVEISAGHAKVSGSISIEDQTIAQRTYDLPLELVFELDGGIDLRRALLDFTG